MAQSPRETFDLDRTYIHLEDGPAAARIEVGAGFWDTIDQRAELAEGRLLTAFRFDSTADWPHWEMHPAGDEIVCLVSGALDLVLDDGMAERTVALRDGATAVIPRGVWHRAIVREPSRALFITRAAGTRHRPL